MNQKDEITAQLEEALIYSVIVAGKSATFTDSVMRKLANYIEGEETLFQALRRLREKRCLYQKLLYAKTGNYEKLYNCICGLLDATKLDLATCAPEDLEAFHGIGPKTSRFFILWTRPGARYAALDVHILRWLASQGIPNVPRSTPNGKRYTDLERIFLEKADALNMTARDLDRKIWMAGSNYKLS